MLVLQDWASERALSGGTNSHISELGRDPTRRTNLRLERLLLEVFGFDLKDVYATNVFPFVKPGGMSASVPQELVNTIAAEFTLKEIEIAEPMLVVGLGAVAHRALKALAVEHIAVPHPAARIGGFEAHLKAWATALDSVGQ
jgi:restriction system protein